MLKGRRWCERLLENSYKVNISSSAADDYNADLILRLFLRTCQWNDKDPLPDSYIRLDKYTVETSAYIYMNLITLLTGNQSKYPRGK